MEDNNDKFKGYVYILEVKDIDLPVCKIGMTSRNPYDRCLEINNSSTGDFIWEVAHQVAVDNCKKLESLVHKKLEPLRQRKREFFNINAEVAFKALLSIIENQSEIKEIAIEETNAFQIRAKKTSKQKKAFSNKDSAYTELLHTFTSLLNIKGRTFGQLNRPVFGMSDGNEGVQWNIAVWTNKNKQNIQLGINLEGMKYNNWPIANFILSELEQSTIQKIKSTLKQPENIHIRFLRDAWQATSRPNIVEKYLGGQEWSFAETDSNRWRSILTEALDCLNKQKNYRGRAKQLVTYENKPKNGERIRNLPVTPHLLIWTAINLSGDITQNLNSGITQLKPVHEWVARVSQ